MIIFFGLAGSGKSSQAELLAAKLDWLHVSAGKILRQYDDQRVQADLAEGKLVDYRITNRLIEQVADQHHNRVVLDGYPRQLEQTGWILDQHRPIEVCFLINVSLETIKQRLLARGRHDDTEEAITQRVAIFKKETQEVLELFRKKAIKIIEIDGEQSIEAIHQQIMEHVNELATN